MARHRTALFTSSGERLPLVTFSANILLQFPVQASRYQWYGTFGVGVYGLSLASNVNEPEGVWNVGGVAKVTLAGPLKLRVDYRAFAQHRCR